MVHERIVISVHPEYVKALSKGRTDLDECFQKRENGFSHCISLSREQQQRFLYLVDKITKAEDYGHEYIEEAAFMEILVMLNKASRKNTVSEEMEESIVKYNHQVDEILAYINRNIMNQIKIEELAEQFFLSETYICRIFKAATGTTINKYITGRRISIAKSLLNDGHSVQDTYEQSGFSDYSAFFKAFTKAVGMSPKKYAQCSNG